MFCDMYTKAEMLEDTWLRQYKVYNEWVPESA